MVILNLPREERNLWKNVIVVGVIPGPKEPEKDINPFLRPLVDDLCEYWSGVVCHEEGIPCVYKMALTCIANDIPATRKCGGFLAHMAKKGIYWTMPTSSHFTVDPQIETSNC